MEINQLIRKNIAQMQSYSSARDEFQTPGQEMIFLDANENPFENGVNRYPDTQQRELKDILSVMKEVKITQILLGNGSDEVLDLLFRAFCDPNVDNVITLPPTYGMYSVLANLNAVENKEVVLSKDFQPNVDEILEKINANTKIIFLCSPNNPTGNSFNDKAIIRLLKSFDGLIVIDEAYIDFSEKESWIKEINRFPNLVITQTLSKAYGMAGLRIGILYASSEIIAVLNKIKPPYNLNTLSREKAVRKLNQDTLQFQLRKILKEREKVSQLFSAIPFVEKVFPTDSNFILLKVDDAQKRYNQLIGKGIVVRNRSNQILCENCLRVTIGTKEENEKLSNVLKSLI